MSEADVHLPLSGDVTQSFFPLTVNVGRSGNDALEKDALSVASYGRQLGRIEDVLLVLLKHVPLSNLSKEEKEAIVNLKCLLRELASVKQNHGAKHILWPDCS